MPNDIVVLKFGSSVLTSRTELPTAVHEIYRWYRTGHRVVVVVSAIGDATDLLLTSARELADPNGPNESAIPDPHATAELLATGERASAALMGIALDRAGIPARVLDPRDIQLSAVGSPMDSELISVNPARLHFLSTETPVLVVPGFFGYDSDGRVHLLGRGGSDLTAVFLAHALDAARCRLIKDVDGVYEFDPASGAPTAPRRFAALTYSDALERAAPLVQPKAVHFLERHQRTAEVAAIGRSYASIIGGDPAGSKVSCPRAARPPTKVALMGLGTVGLGVYRRLAAMKEDFEVTAILVRNPLKHGARGIPSRLLCTSPPSFLADNHERVDIVVDALPGVEPSNRLAAAFLQSGVSVVSANKSMIAEAGPRLSALAGQAPITMSRGPCELFYSAAVGGSAPMIEAIRHVARTPGIRSISGILNGTCNYLLNLAADGAALHDALGKVQALGLAELNPIEDLSGRDAARKLRILTRHAFGRDLDPERLDLEPIDVTTFPRARQARATGQVLRLVATASLNPGRFTTHVRLEALAAGHPLADVRGEWNRLLIEHTDGATTTINGRGAGRWPTTEAVMADLLDFRMTDLR